MEQLLTTGGGWQDQCGGLYGGAKISQSGKKLPVKITTQQISEWLVRLSSHLTFICCSRNSSWLSRYGQLSSSAGLHWQDETSQKSAAGVCFW